MDYHAPRLIPAVETDWVETDSREELPRTDIRGRKPFLSIQGAEFSQEFLHRQRRAPSIFPARVLSIEHTDHSQQKRRTTKAASQRKDLASETTSLHCEGFLPAQPDHSSQASGSTEFLNRIEQYDPKPQQAPKRLRQRGLWVNGRLPSEAPRFEGLTSMSQPATQQDANTQPYWDLRREGRAGDLDSEAEADIVLTLHPTTTLAIEATRLCAQTSPQHIWRNHGMSHYLNEKPDNDLDMEKEHVSRELPTATGHDMVDFATSPAHQAQPDSDENGDHDIALRFSSKAVDKTLGWVFGRDPNKCDILLQDPTKERSVRVSSMHFRIYINDHGIIMIEDMSTNGTYVDNNLLRFKGPGAITTHKRILESGSVITVIVRSDKTYLSTEKASFIIKIPERNESGAKEYAKKLSAYLAARNEVQTKLANKNAMRLFGKNGQGVFETHDTEEIETGNDILGYGGSRFNHGMRWNGGKKYSVVGYVGKGAFAAVYKLATRSEGTIYAAKEIDKLKFKKNGQLDQKFGNELQIIKKLSHPHIVEYCDYQDECNFLYIIMEYVPHGDMLQHMNVNGPLTEFLAASVSRQLCHALQYIHAQGVTHRDIKPDNVLLARLDPMVVKLTDFGLSKLVESHGDAAAMQTFCGTLLYCAPEVYPDYAHVRYQSALIGRRGLGNEKDVTAQRTRLPSTYSSKVDIWSLATVVFHMLAAIPPYAGQAGDQGAQMLRTILKYDVDFSPLKQREISSDCLDLLGKMMSIDPKTRPTAEDCLEHPWILEAEDVVDILPLGHTEGSGSHATGISLLNKSNDDDDSTIVLRHIANDRKLAPPGQKVAYHDDGANIPLRYNTHPVSGLLFGEIREPVEAIPDSGIFGFGQQPNIKSAVTTQALANDENGPPALRHSHASVTSQEHDSHVNDTASQLEDMTVNSSSSNDSRLASYHDYNHLTPVQPPLPHQSGIKRTRQHDEDAITAAATTSKRVMLDDRITPSTTGTTPESKIFDECFGMLIPLEGSFDQTAIILHSRLTTWGRAPTSTHVYIDSMDTRVPKSGLDMIFWYPGIEEQIAAGASWRDSIEKAAVLLKTRKTSGIQVNGVHLKMAEEGRPFLCGKLRTGDIVEICNYGDQFLMYRCEFYRGTSMSERAKGDRFVIEANNELWAKATEAQAKKSPAITV